MRGKGWQHFKKGMEQGIEQGIEKGMEQARATILNIANSMLADGFDCATVMKLTGLSADDLAQIRH